MPPRLSSRASAAGAGESGPSTIAGVSLVVANLLPLWGVWTGAMDAADVFLVYWLENVAVWLLSTVKVATARGTEGDPPAMFEGRTVDLSRAGPFLAVFFAFHYGIFTVGHGVFALGMAHFLTGELRLDTGLLLTGLALLGSHAVSLVLHWFRGGERWRVAPISAMFDPYRRMFLLHVGVIVGWGLLIAVSGGPEALHVLPAVFLVGLKTVADLLLHRRQHRRAAALSGGSGGGERRVVPS